MSKVGRTRVWVCLGLVVLLACATAGAANAGLFGLFGKSKAKTVKAAPVKLSSLLVFPFDLSKDVSVPATMGDDLASALRGMMQGNEKYSAIMYSDKLAPVKRARQDSPPLVEKETKNPFTEDRTIPLRLTKLLAADYYVAGAVEDVQLDSAKKTAEMTLSLELVDGKSGKLVKTLLVTGRTPEGARSVSDDDAIALAAGDAVSKLKSQLMEETKAPEAGTEAPRVNVRPVEVAPKTPEPASKAPEASAPAGTPAAPRTPSATPRGPRPGGSTPPAPPAPRTPGGSGTPATPPTPPSPEL